MSGCVTVVGLGPGDPSLLTDSARRALDAAADLIGYIPFLQNFTIRKMSGIFLIKPLWRIASLAR